MILLREILMSEESTIGITEENVLLSLLGLSRNDFKIITDLDTFKSILDDMHGRGKLDPIDYKIITETINLPFAEITLPFDEAYYIYLGSDVKNDVFTLYHAIGHVYLFKKVGLFIEFALSYKTMNSCTETDVKMEASFLLPVRNIIEDILADTTIYTALSRINMQRAEEYWRSATRDIDKALEKLKALMLEKPSFIDLYIYATMLAESIYKRKEGLTRRTTEKLRKYMHSLGLQEAMELLDSIVIEMKVSSLYDIVTRIISEKQRVTYTVLVNAVVVCIDLKQLGENTEILETI